MWPTRWSCSVSARPCAPTSSACTRGRAPRSASPRSSAPCAPQSRSSTSRRVLVFTAGVPAVQIFVPAVRAFDRGELVVGFSRPRLTSFLCEHNGDHTTARLVLTHPAEVEIPRNHLPRCLDVHVSQSRRCHCLAYRGSSALGWTFNGHCCLSA